MKKYIYTIAILVQGLTACNKEAEAPHEEIRNANATVYQVSIPAYMGADTKAVTFDNSTNPPTASTSFQMTDIIYVYNTNKYEWLATDNGGYLSPSEDGKFCVLTGTLSGTIEVGDVLLLMCNLNGYDPSNPYDKNNWHYNYYDQNGTQAGVVDGATAKLKVKSIDGEGYITFCQEDDTDDSTAHFDNVQAMFRFQFKDGTDSPITVKSLLISSKNNMLVKRNHPHLNSYYQDNITIYLETATSDPIYTALCVDESRSDGDVLTFWATSGDNKLYKGTKNGPAGEKKFKNGKYYYNSSPIALDLLGDVMSVTWTNSGDPISPDEYYDYIFNTSAVDITASGVTAVSRIIVHQGGTVNLSGITAYLINSSRFIESNSALELVVNGTNTIECKGNDYSIFNLSSLKLSGNGTLTVTTQNTGYCGILTNNYQWGDNNHDVTTELDVTTLLAAPGYTVTRSARTDNPDGTYTWTYTVMPGTKVVNLTGLTEDSTAQNGDILTGALANNVKVSIADGATVTLAGITINGGDDWNTEWAGITCEGNAILVLAEGTTNSVKPFGFNCAAVSVPSGKTLTIQGSGSLTADAKGSGGAGIGGDALKYYGNIIINGAANVSAYGGSGSAGIGSGHCNNNTSVTGGDITINTSGTVKTYGGEGAAGIGAGGSGRDHDNRCGNILISKGTIETTGGEYGAGIGTGFGSMGSSVCGTITITDGVTSVTATKGADAEVCIGLGYRGICSTIKFGDQTMYNGSSWAMTPINGETYGGLSLAITTTTYENDTWTLRHK